MYDYRFLDDQNKKIIRSSNVKINENMFYKERTAESINANKQSEQVPLEEILESDVVNRRKNIEVESLKLESKLGSELEQIVQSVTPEILIRRSSRKIVAPQRYSPLHYLLLTDVGEPMHFVETMQGDEYIKWELAMEEEIKSLQKNKT